MVCINTKMSKTRESFGKADVSRKSPFATLTLGSLQQWAHSEDKKW